VVEFGWKQAQLADSAAEIRRLGEELYKRLSVFGEHLGKLGKSLGGSVEAYNRAVGSLEQQILPAARRFETLGLRVNRELEPMQPIDQLVRIPRAADSPELDAPDYPKLP
jgi:DNA recombination protein RmuC